MSLLKAVCLTCGQACRVRRHELDHAARPRCQRCGGPLEVSERGRAGRAAARAARRQPSPAPADPVEHRILPVRETTRYEFNEYQSLYLSIINGMGRNVTPRDVEEIRTNGPMHFYTRQVHGMAMRSSVTDPWMAPRALISAADMVWYESGCPYYKVWPSIANALCHTEMQIDGEHLRLPHRGFEIRLPKTDNPLAPAPAACVAGFERIEGQDDRDWSLLVVFLDGDHKDYESHTWVLDVPVKTGRSLEDSLGDMDVDSLCPNPELARRMLRLAVGVTFFGMDRHELILPDVPRRIIERYQRQNRQPSPEEAGDILREAREEGRNGFKVGSEIDLPRPEVRQHDQEDPVAAGREGLTQGHVRRGHLRFQAVGEGRRERRLTFVAPTVVRPDLPLAPPKGYRVRIT
jgi:hypothetical protein